MKISIKTVGIDIMEKPSVQKFGNRINILIDDKLKYVANCGLIQNDSAPIEDENGNPVYSLNREIPSFPENLKHGTVYTYSSKDNNVVITYEDRYKTSVKFNDQELLVEKYPKGKYTYYPIFLNGIEIAEGVLLNASKNFSIDFDIYLLDEFAENVEAICVLCRWLFVFQFREHLSPNSVFHERVFSLNPKKNHYDPNWLKSKFNIILK